MLPTPGVAVIAIDGADPETIARYAAAGWLPEISRAIGRSREVRVQTLGDIFHTAVWPCAASGVAVENHGLHAYNPLRNGSLETLDALDFQLPTPFWETAVRAGLRACVVDVPFYGPASADPALEGLRLLEWGSHPAIREPGSFPSALASAIHARHGAHPCRNDRPTLSTAADVAAMRDQLCDGARRRARVMADLLDSDPCNLLVAVFSETHVAEHQFLVLDDPRHPDHDAGLAAALGESPVRVVYQAVDAAIGDLLRRLPPETTVLLTCLLGSRVTYGGSQLLGDLLVRMGLSVPARPLSRRMLSWYRNVVPAPLRVAIKDRLPQPIARLSHRELAALFDWSATRAFALPWSYEGYLRLNLRGREPRGIVDPGPEREALLTRVEEALGELRVAGTGEPAVARMVRAQEIYRGRASGELPDLMALWRNEGRLEAVESPTYGHIANSYIAQRSQHTAAAVVFAAGGRIRPGSPIEDVRDIDIAPTVLALLGVPPPGGLDGRAIPELTGAHA